MYHAIFCTEKLFCAASKSLLILALSAAEHVRKHSYYNAISCGIRIDTYLALALDRNHSHQ